MPGLDRLTKRRARKAPAKSGQSAREGRQKMKAAAILTLLLLIASASATQPTSQPTESELKAFANSLCNPIDQAVNKSYVPDLSLGPTTFHHSAKLLSVDLKETDSVLHPVQAVIAIEIYTKLSGQMGSADRTELITAKAVKVESGWLAISCTSLVEDEQINPPTIVPHDIGKVTDLGATALQKIIDSIGIDEAAAKAARAVFKQASADLVVARRRADAAESAMNRATEKCLSSLHSTDEYKAAKSKMDQAMIDKKNAETDSNWQARLDGDSTYNKTRSQLRNMESAALDGDVAVISAKQELDTARKDVDEIEQKIRGDYGQEASPSDN
jgi:hypothetical protein